MNWDQNSDNNPLATEFQAIINALMVAKIMEIQNVKFCMNCENIVNMVWENNRSKEEEDIRHVGYQMSLIRKILAYFVNSILST